MLIYNVFVTSLSFYKEIITKHRVFIVFGVAVFFINYLLLYLPTNRTAKHVDLQTKKIQSIRQEVEEMHKKFIPPFKEIKIGDKGLETLSTYKKSLAIELNESGKYSITRGDYVRAIGKLEESLGIAQSAEALYYKGYAFFSKGDYTEAIESWKKCLSMLVDQEIRKEINLYIGLAYLQIDEDKNAVRFFNAAFPKIKS